MKHEQWQQKLPSMLILLCSFLSQEVHVPLRYYFGASAGQGSTQWGAQGSPARRADPGRELWRQLRGSRGPGRGPGKGSVLEVVSGAHGASLPRGGPAQVQGEIPEAGPECDAGYVPWEMPMFRSS